MAGSFLFLAAVSVLYLGVASYTDLKARIVPNRLTYAAVLFGLLFHAGLAWSEGNPWVLGAVLAQTGLAFAFAYLLYRLGLWAAGDVKLFAGITALNPFNPALLFSVGAVSFPFAPFFAAPFSRGDWLQLLPLFSVEVFLFSLFAFLPWIFLFAAGRLAWDRQVRRSIALEVSKKAPGKTGVLVAWHALLATAKHVFRREVRISALEEGMIAGERIVEEGERVRREESINIWQALQYRGKGMESVLADPLRAGGLEREDILRLQALVREKKLEDRIWVKESAPMVPALFLSYLALAFSGDVLWNLLLR